MPIWVYGIGLVCLLLAIGLFAIYKLGRSNSQRDIAEKASNAANKMHTIEENIHKLPDAELDKLL